MSLLVLIAITIGCIAWSLWIRRVTWTCRWEVAATLNIALQGAAVLLMSPLANETVGQTLHTLTGKWNLQNYIGHDCYIAEVMKPYLQDEALYMLRFHSFYPWHKHGAYDHLCNDQDRAMLKWVLEFNKYDLYSKGHAKPDMAAIKPYYDDLFAEFLPATVAW